MPRETHRSAVVAVLAIIAILPVHSVLGAVGVVHHRVGVVTITGVEVARDLGSAKVWVRVLGDAGALTESLEGLGAAAPYLRRELGKLLHLRKVPELRFLEDRSMEHARRIEEILSDVAPGDEAPADGDAAPGDLPADPGTDG